MLNDLHNHIRMILRRNYGGFLSPVDIDSAINASSQDLFNELVSKYREGDNLPDLLKNFKEEHSVTLSSGAGTITGAAGSEVISAVSVISGEDCDGIVTSGDRDWSSKDRDVLLKHGVFAEEHSHIFIDRLTLTLAGGATGVDLPCDFIEDLGSVYIEDGMNNLYEGKVLHHNEFLNRVNSALLAPDSENPIATIYGGRIDLYPRSGSSQTFVLPHYKYPVERKALFRITDDSSADLQVEVKPDTITSAKVFALRQPAQVEVDYTVSSGNVTLNTPTTETDWPRGAFSELANRALTYLGFSSNDENTPQLEALVEGMDANK